MSLKSGRTRQDPPHPVDDPDPGQQNPKIPEGPSDTPRPQPDPGKQPIDTLL